MTSLHAICPRGLNLKATGFPVFESGSWELSEADAARIVGGRLYLHEKKTQASYFGGTVQSFRVLGPEAEQPGHIVFTLRAEAAGKGAPWAGSKQVKSPGLGGLVED